MTAPTDIASAMRHCSPFGERISTITYPMDLWEDMLYKEVAPVKGKECQKSPVFHYNKLIHSGIALTIIIRDSAFGCRLITNRSLETCRRVLCYSGASAESVSYTSTCGNGAELTA